MNSPRLVALAALLLAAADDEELPPFDIPEIDIPSGADLTAPEVVDDRPSPWACSTRTLLDERDCLFDAAPTAVSSTAPANLASARALVAELCAATVRPVGGEALHRQVAEACGAALESAAASCAIGGPPLIDDGGRFAEPHARCYESLRVALGGVRTVVDSYASCCDCLVRERCLDNMGSCARSVVAGKSPVPPACAAVRRCDEPCRAASLVGVIP